MSQRAINQTMVDLAAEYGVAENDKIVLSENQLKALIAELDGIRRKAVKALDKGGLVLVSAPDTGAYITTYTLESYRRTAS
jgi:hypothetical protein